LSSINIIGKARIDAAINTISGVSAGRKTTNQLNSISPVVLSSSSVSVMAYKKTLIFDSMLLLFATPNVFDKLDTNE
jgi:hypothetical protein